MSATTFLVTGGSGYIASWIIHYLLEQGHTVHATVRDLKREDKVAHLNAMGAEHKGSLKLFEADLLRDGSFAEAMQGCQVVLHTASPFQVAGIKDAQKQLVDPALKGTRNVLATVDATESVTRVVLTSSVAAIYGDSCDAQGVDQGIFNESHWNKTSSLKHNPYPYSKTVAEQEAWTIYKAQKRWELVVINPGFVFGPSLSPRLDSTSVDFMKSMLDGRFKQGAPNLFFGVVDVRDVAQAHIAAALTPKAQGRHILVAETLNVLQIATHLKEHYRERFPVPTKLVPTFLLYLVGPFMGFSWSYIKRNIGIPMAFDNTKSIDELGITYRPLKETIIEHAEHIIAVHL